MNEFSFITFQSSAPTDSTCTVKLPIDSTSLDISFYFYAYMSSCTLDIIEIGGGSFTNISKTLEYSGDYNWHIRIASTIALTDKRCWYFRMTYGSTVVYSNLFKNNFVQTGSKIIYYCNEYQFGFNYTISNTYYSNNLFLPITIKNPNYPQEDVIYTNANGVRRVLSAKIDTEYELETEYMPVEWHEKLVIALAHDEVYLNSVRLQKTSPYEINYEEFDELPCGTRLYKASAKMTKNTTQRNTNC